MIKTPEEIDVYDNETPFVYIFVREDLPPIQQLIQASHATHESGIKFGKIEDKISHFCVFGVPDEKSIKNIKVGLDGLDVRSYEFFEPDFNIGISALATEPIIGKKRELFSDFKLLKMKRGWF